MVVATLFENNPPRGGTVGWGLALGLVVTILLGVQAFGTRENADGFGYGGESALASTVFGLHIATVAFVVGEALVFEGRTPSYASLTIGSGTAATLLQAALVARCSAETPCEGWAIATLVFQSFANGTMLAIIIADLRGEPPQNSRSESAARLLEGVF